MRLLADKLAVMRGDLLLFENLSFSAESGEAVQVTGPNGSGKSTLLRVLAGLIRPLEGSVRLEGLGERSEGDAIAYLGHQNAMKPALSVRENLAFWHAFGGGEAEMLDAAIEAADLGTLADLPFSYLSAGQKRRTALARLLVAERPVWLLDEPTAALDAATTKRFSALMAQHCRTGGIIVAATHLPLGLDGVRTVSLGETPPELLS